MRIYSRLTKLLSQVRAHQRDPQIHILPAALRKVRFLTPSKLQLFTYKSIYRKMPERRELQQTIRARICELHLRGFSYSQIHEYHPNISRSTIGYTVRNETIRLDNASRRRAGRHRVISEEQEAIILQKIKDTPKITYEELRTEDNNMASTRTIQRLLRRNNIQK